MTPINYRTEAKVLIKALEPDHDTICLQWQKGNNNMIIAYSKTQILVTASQLHELMQLAPQILDDLNYPHEEEEPCL